MTTSITNLELMRVQTFSNLNTKAARAARSLYEYLIDANQTGLTQTRFEFFKFLKFAPPHLPTRWSKAFAEGRAMYVMPVYEARPGYYAFYLGPLSGGAWPRPDWTILTSAAAKTGFVQSDHSSPWFLEYVETPPLAGEATR